MSEEGRVEVVVGLFGLDGPGWFYGDDEDFFNDLTEHDEKRCFAGNIWVEL